jgi:hypothetical protein
MRLFATTILLLLTAILFACTGYFSASNQANSNLANSQVISLPEDQNVEANANTDDLANANANIQNLPVKRPPLSPKPEPLTRIAPDDSVITAENNADGDLVETRVFKNHDMLAKVERILTASRRGGTLRVFLKNGRVYELPAGKLKNALSDSPDEIIKSVGDETVTAGSPSKTPPDTKNGARTGDAAPTPRP